MGGGPRDYGIPGTTVFDGYLARKGYALNRMCYSFNSADNRAEFKRDEDAYCRKYGLGDEQRAAISCSTLRLAIAARCCAFSPYFAQYASSSFWNSARLAAELNE